MENNEGIPHFANKAVLWKRLDNKRKVGDFHIFYDRHGRGFEFNLMDGVTEVVQEADFGFASQAPYRADILLKRRNEPPTAIEITHTSPPSPAKLADAARLGIDIYEVQGGFPPFSEKGLKVLAAHIAPCNVKAHEQFTQRMTELYEWIANPPTLDDGFIRVVKNWRGSLDRHDKAKWDDVEEMAKQFADLRSEIRQGHVFCLRCKKPNNLLDGGRGLSYSSTLIHRSNGGCGYFHLCYECEFTIRGGWNGEPSDDAVDWFPVDDCPNCQEVQRAHEVEWELKTRRGPVGYVVDGRTVSREHFLGLLSLLDLTSVIACEYLATTGEKTPRINELRYITASSIQDLKDAVYSGPDDQNDKALRPASLFGGSMPPCPLTVFQ